jgi:O-methyltransferase involved in polyketide biosynthesis
VDAGFDPGKPALFLWEGVMMSLDREAVEATLRKIASCAKGSVVAFDYLTTKVLESQALYWRSARAGLRAAGEPLKFGIDSTRRRANGWPHSSGLADSQKASSARWGKRRKGSVHGLASQLRS